MSTTTTTPTTTSKEYTILGYVTTFKDRDEQACGDIDDAIRYGLASGLPFMVWQLTQPADAPRLQRCLLWFDPQGLPRTATLDGAR